MIITNYYSDYLFFFFFFKQTLHRWLINLSEDNVDIKSELHLIPIFSSSTCSVRFLQHLFPFGAFPIECVSLGFLLSQAVVVMRG